MCYTLLDAYILDSYPFLIYTGRLECIDIRQAWREMLALNTYNHLVHLWVHDVCHWCSRCCHLPHGALL